MKVKWNTIDLATDDYLAQGMTLNGRQLIQSSSVFRKAVENLYSRKNRSQTFGFQVRRKFSSVRENEEFLLNHHNTLDDSGTLTLRVGAFGDTEADVLAANTALVAVNIVEQVGLMCLIRYQFRFPKISGIDYSPPANEDMRSGSVIITQDADQVTVSGEGWPSIPARIIVSVSSPSSGGMPLTAIVQEDSITTDGFVADFQGAPTTTGYKLHWIAIL